MVLNRSDLSTHDCVDQLLEIFDQCFYLKYNTRLVRGESEPVYLAANDQCDYHQIVFSHGYFSSALHEVAHWCVAGASRRTLDDYGYWYVPDGRNAQQQQQFEQVEVKPQALEWIFSVAADVPFRVSIDNLSGQCVDSKPFMTAVLKQVNHYCDQGLPVRAGYFRDALASYFTCGKLLNKQSFKLNDLLL